MKAYFVILHISTLYGAIIHVIADVICMPFYIKHKQYDVVINRNINFLLQ